MDFPLGNFLWPRHSCSLPFFTPVIQAALHPQSRNYTRLLSHDASSWFFHLTNGEAHRGGNLRSFLPGKIEEEVLIIFQINVEVDLPSLSIFETFFTFPEPPLCGCSVS